MIKILYLILAITLCGCKFGGHRDSEMTMPTHCMMSTTFTTAFSVYENDCGPIAEYQILRNIGQFHKLGDIIEAMGWSQKHPDITDSLMNHTKMLKMFGIDHKARLSALNMTDLIERIQKNRPSLIMLKLSTVSYHWVVFLGIYNGKVMMSWGDGSLKMMSIAEFNGKFNGTGIIYF